MPGVHKIGTAISRPRITGRIITDMSPFFFLVLACRTHQQEPVRALSLRARPQESRPDHDRLFHY